MELQTQLATQLVEQTNYGIIILNDKQQIVLWNNWVATQLDVKADDAYMQTLHTMLSQHNLPEIVIDTIALVFSDAQSRQITARFVTSFPNKIKVSALQVNQQKFCLLEIFDKLDETKTNVIPEVDTLLFQYKQDLAVSAHLIDRISGMRKIALPGLKIWQKEKLSSGFSGDIVLSAPRPSGGINILVGDFVGRGLPAAVGALPVAEVFYGMTEKGFGLSDIVEEINKKLQFVLPESFFCAACMLELEKEGKLLAVWNGGVPDVLVLDEQDQIKYRVSSTHIPLGVNTTNKEDFTAEFLAVDIGDRIFICTDGVILAENDEKKHFGIQELERILSLGGRLDSIQQVVTEHMSTGQQQDDLTLVEFTVSEMNKLAGTLLELPQKETLPAAGWNAEFTFSAQVLRNVDLVPLLINVLMHIQAPYEHRQRIYTILAEMCSNALEHGVLRLNSELKKSPNGFAEYYMLRKQRLADLENGSIDVQLSHRPIENGGALTISVEDSGEGFDYLKHTKDSEEDTMLSGRGVVLLRKLCKEVYYSGRGNSVHAEYHWSI